MTDAEVDVIVAAIVDVIMADVRRDRATVHERVAALERQAGIAPSAQKADEPDRVTQWMQECFRSLSEK